MSEITIEVQTRSTTGKNANRRLRASGQVPAVVYGDRKDAVAIQVDQRTIHNLLRTSEGGENSIFLLKVSGTRQSRHAMIREMQVDPVDGSMKHIDFMRINLSKRVEVEVPVELIGEADGVRNLGGILDFMTREVSLECLPADIPPRIDVDVSMLGIGDHIAAGALSLPEGVTLQGDPLRVIVAVHAPRIDEAEEEEQEEGDLIEAEGAQPEVLKQKSDEA